MCLAVFIQTDPLPGDFCLWQDQKILPQWPALRNGQKDGRRGWLGSASVAKSKKRPASTGRFVRTLEESLFARTSSLCHIGTNRAAHDGMTKTTTRRAYERFAPAVYTERLGDVSITPAMDERLRETLRRIKQGKADFVRDALEAHLARHVQESA